MRFAKNVGKEKWRRFDTASAHKEEFDRISEEGQARRQRTKSHMVP